MTAELKGFEKYTFYSDGRIWSKSKNCFMTSCPNTDGYPSSVFINSKAKNGYRQTITFHILIAKAFIPNPNNYPEVNHIDGNKSNNDISNLEWCTRSENLRHCHKLGLRNSDGARKASAKLKEWQVKAIRFLYHHLGYQQKRIGEIYGINQTHVSNIILRKSWAHI